MVAVVFATLVNASLFTGAPNHDENQVEEGIAHHENRADLPPPPRQAGPGQNRRSAETIPEKQTSRVPQEDAGPGEVVAQESGARSGQGQLPRRHSVGAPFPGAPGES